MKNFILFFLIFASHSYFYSQKFPISYKIERSYQECSQCEVKTRSNWSLVNPGSYSAEIRDAVEYKIFAEKSYPEKVGWYFSEQDYDKACDVSRSGKHVWKDIVSYLSDNMSKDYYLDYNTKEANRTEKLRNEEEAARLAKEKEKKKYEDYKVEYEKLFTSLDEKRKEARLLLEKNEIESYLVLQELNCNTWKSLDSIYESSWRSWDYYDIKTTMKINYRDYWLDVNDFAAQALLSKRFDKLRKATSILIKNGEDFEGWYAKWGMTIARYSSHGSLLSNNRSWFWFTQRAVKGSSDQNNKEKWCKLMIADFNKFEAMGILQSTDSLKFIVKAWTNQLSVLVSQSASSKTKNAFETYQGPSNYISKFISSVDENFICKKENQVDNSKIKLVDENLYLFSYPPSYYRFYFYINENGDIFIVNYSKDKDPSKKKWAKIIAKSKEVRDIDLGIIGPK